MIPFGTKESMFQLNRKTYIQKNVCDLAILYLWNIKASFKSSSLLEWIVLCLLNWILFGSHVTGLHIRVTWNAYDITVNPLLSCLLYLKKYSLIDKEKYLRNYSYLWIESLNFDLKPCPMSMKNECSRWSWQRTEPYK